MPISTSVPLCVPTQKGIPTSEISRAWRACKMLSHISDPPRLAIEDQVPKSILRTAGTDYMIELVSIASTHCWKPYWNRVSENERHSLQFREGTRLRNDPRNECRFDVLLDSHESIVSVFPNPAGQIATMQPPGSKRFSFPLRSSTLRTHQNLSFCLLTVTTRMNASRSRLLYIAMLRDSSSSSSASRPNARTSVNLLMWAFSITLKTVGKR